jgi:hypothetical protein
VVLDVRQIVVVHDRSSAEGLYRESAPNVSQLLMSPDAKPVLNQR